MYVRRNRRVLHETVAVFPVFFVPHHFYLIIEYVVVIGIIFIGVWLYPRDTKGILVTFI